MSELLKSVGRHCLKQIERWVITGANIPRLKGLQSWWQRQGGNPNEINALRERYPHLLHQ